MTCLKVDCFVERVAVRGCILPNGGNGFSGVCQRRVIVMIAGCVKFNTYGELREIFDMVIAGLGLQSTSTRNFSLGMCCNRTWKEDRLHTLFV